MAILMTLVIGYSIYRTKNLIEGPLVTVLSPATGETIRDKSVEIRGVGENISYISLNDRRIYLSEDGDFSEKLLLQNGYNIFTIKAQDKFGKTTEKKLELVYKQS